ncbi:MAG: DUF547 domain-containing protein [Candidatus Latescibacteria bacterium]|nr:DUF547 domain-containing protein [Candidatus Latescibacterota bacterium]
MFALPWRRTWTAWANPARAAILPFSPPQHELAYWINAYNAFVLRGVIDGYPVSRVDELGGSAAPTLIDYLLLYLPATQADLLRQQPGMEIVFIQYDWTLNDRPVK